MLTRLGLSILVLFCLALEFAGLRTYVTFDSYNVLAKEVGEGRFQGRDAERLAAVMPGTMDLGCIWGSALRNLSILQLYLADLEAFQRNADPLAASSDAAVTTVREAATLRLERVLACTPFDGDLWLRQALIVRALGAPEQAVDRLHELSVRTAPYEGWVKSRRDHFFPDLAEKDTAAGS